MSDVATVPAHVHLLPGKEKGPLRGHPWVFSGAIARIQVDDLPPAPGDWVKVIAANGTALGWGHWGSGSIAVRIVAEPDLFAPPDARWWSLRFKECLQVRHAQGLGAHPDQTDCFRLVHGEGDGLSGLVIDLYGTLAVVQTHSSGMHRAWPELLDGLRDALGPALTAVINKSRSLLDKLPENTDGGTPDGAVWSVDDEAANTPCAVREHGIRYEIDPVAGQKTGFFLDQRDNRKLLMEWVGGRAVLNAFSYTGGFSMAALRGGSPHVVSLDASEPAIAAARHHAEMNGFAERHEGVVGDVLTYIRQSESLPPVVILDPPAYAKSRGTRHKAVQGYKRLNATTLRKMPADSLLWTFSCSQVVDAQLFEDTIVAAAVESGRSVRIVRRLGQPGDHPTRVGHPEARYLKGLVLHIV